MKKHLLYALALATTMVACTEDYDDWAPAQQYGPEEAQTVTLTVAPVEALDLGTVTSDTVQIFVPTVQAVEGATTSYTITLYNADKSASEVLTSEDGTVLAADLQAAIANLYGRRPEARTMEMEIAAYTTVNGQTVKTVATSQLIAAPQAPVISKNHYLIGAPSEWSPSCTTMPFTHSGKDVYEDPVFTVVFPVTDGEIWFAIADDYTVAAIDDWSLVFGCAEGNGNNGMEGKLARRADLSDEGSWKITIAGDAKFVKMTINMLDYTYKLEKVNYADYIYTIGGSDWSTCVPMKHTDNGNYLGFDWINSEFKFRPSNADNDWNGDFGQDPNGAAGALITEGEQNCKAPAAGFYAIKVNMVSMTCELVPITTISLVGNAVNGDTNWATDYDMTYDANLKAWTITCDLTDGEMKFRANHDWVYNWGGTPDAATQGGSNIQVAAGNYTIVLKALCDGHATYTMTKN